MAMRCQILNSMPNGRINVSAAQIQNSNWLIMALGRKLQTV